MARAPATVVDSTASYYERSAVARSTRWVLRSAQHLWPALAVRAATRIFCTPLPPKWMSRRHPWPAGWTRSRWPFEGASVTLYAPPAAPAATGSHPPSAARVALLVHGWGGHAGQLLPIAQALLAAGWQPWLLEMPAHGRNAGSTSSLPQFARAIEYAAARLHADGAAHPQALVAHSLGANAAAYAVARGLPVQRLVLLAPPASPHEYTRRFAQVFGLHERVRQAMQQRIEAREAALMPRFEPAAVGPALRAATLVVHDRDDRINPFDEGAAFAAATAGARLHATRGLGHRRLLKDAGVLAAVTSFVTDEGAGTATRSRG